MSWIRLKKGNDWGTTYVARAPLNRYGTADAKRGLKLTDGELCPVRLRDGTEYEGRVKFRKRHRTIQDMGHSYGMTDPDPCVVVSLHGHELEIEFDDVCVNSAWIEELERFA